MRVTASETIQILQWHETMLVKKRLDLWRQMSQTRCPEVHKVLLEQDTKLANEIKACMAQISALGGHDN